MGSLRVRLIDRNRYAKRYPLIRAPKRYVYQGEEYMAVEVGSIYFDNSDTGSLQFEAPFPDANYTLAISARDSGDSGGANVNIYISSHSNSGVTVQSSGEFTGYVDVFAIRVGV